MSRLPRPDPERIGIWGASGQGKSTFVKALVRDRRRLVVFDPMGEHKTTIIEARADLIAALRRSWSRGFRLSYKPAFSADPVIEVNWLASALVRLQEPYRAGAGAGLTFVVEELANCAPNARALVATGSLAGLAARGRHYGITLIGTSQRLAEVSTTFRGNTSVDVFFAQSDDTDYQAIRRKIGREGEARVRRLAPHHYVMRRSGRLIEGRNRL
jgi:DNA helicase HerA-like ATPase